MRIFAIADPHLSRASPKPMDIFGGNWEGHPEILFTKWQEVVQENDLVLIPGDISWAMRLSEALLDLKDIAALKGQKVILKGNHDYWWNSLSKVRKALPETIYALQNDAFRFRGKNSGVVIAGSRGWICPNAFQFTAEDHKIYLRELERLKLSLKTAQKLRQAGDKLIAMLHFPPTNAKLEPSGFTEIIQQAAPDALLFGHLHGEDSKQIITDLDKVAIHFVAADALEFKPKFILAV